MRTLVVLSMLILVGCQAAVPSNTQPREIVRPRQWLLVERPYEEVEWWVQDAADAIVAGQETTLVFEPMPVAGEKSQTLSIDVGGSACGHRIRGVMRSPERMGVGGVADVALTVECRQNDVHRVDVRPSREGVQVLSFEGSIGEVPGRAGYYVRGPKEVVVKFTADSKGLGGIEVALSELDR